MGYQLVHVGEVVEAEQADGGQLFRSGEVAEVIAVVVAAGWTGAAIGDRVAVPLPAGFAQVEAEAVGGVGDEGGAVASEAGGDRAVEEREAEPRDGEPGGHGGEPQGGPLAPPRAPGGPPPQP